MRRLSSCFTAAALMLTISVPVHADVVGGAARMTIAGSVDAPLGYQLFCLTNPHHCRGGGSSEVEYTQQLGELLQQVNTSINRTIRPKSDRADQWSIGVAQGDCEEYALAKRAELVSLGVPASAVRIALAQTSKREGHAVVVVRTSIGDLVLDNLTSSIRNWDETGLLWIAIAASNARAWQNIN